MKRIHESAEIHPTAVIYDNVEIGPNVKIGPFCIIGAPAEHRTFKGEPKGVKILDGAVLHGHNTVDAGTERDTIISFRSWLMKGVHVGHDAFIGDDCTLACHCLIGGHAHLESWVNVGLGAAIHQRVNVPSGVMVGMNAVITKKTELKAFHKFAGVPARNLGPNLHLMQQLELNLEDIASLFK